jgi:hypothetical protein
MEFRSKIFEECTESGENIYEKSVKSTDRSVNGGRQSERR